MLTEIAKAAQEIAGKIEGDAGEIGKVENAGAGAADAGSVNGIAQGMKAIVEAAKKGGVVLKDTGDGGNAANGDAGKVFAGNNAGDADADAADKAAEAVSKASGEQILNAIVTAAADGNKTGAKAGDAQNPIDAAIGSDGDNAEEFHANMQKNAKVAAAIVLRGMAKNGKFALNGGNTAGLKAAVEAAVAKLGELLTEIAKAAQGIAGKIEGAAGEIGKVENAGSGAADAGSVNGIAQGMKAIVEAAKKGGVVLKDTGDGGNAANGDAGKVFAGNNAAGANAAAADKAAAAVSKASGEQILNAIVAAADGNKDGKRANQAENPIDAAIGSADAAEFHANMRKNAKVAAAIVLRGMAKNGKFALNGGEKKAGLKAAVEAAVAKLGELLTEIAKAAQGIAGKIEGADGEIGEVKTANAGAADKDSVNGIAQGMKAIVEAAKKGGVVLKDTGDGGNADGNAGKVFAGGAAGDAAAADKAAAAVSKASGEQILNAIVAAADGGNKDGKRANQAENPIDAAIGTANDNAAEFHDKMKKNAKVAAAIVLRGMAKNGKFALNGGNGKEGLKAAVEAAVAIGKVENAGAGAADAGSVNGIAQGMKAIVEAAKKGGVVLKDTGDGGGADGNAGKVFAGRDAAGANAAAADKAAEAVSKASGEQILNAIVAAADGDKTGAKADQAQNPIDAAIGSANDNAEAFHANIQKNAKVAAAIVDRDSKSGTGDCGKD
ncbi:borrelia lipoprotein (plasmid) [Borreliella garinii PBr]|uniref:Borrelia lipoprotein n=1 Tax=Borreliella garinii PBr TaxID=498743 RepID=B8F1F6_BORGR|nr:borrelia lipoprotein [Borreliella garinii PBr]